MVIALVIISVIALAAVAWAAVAGVLLGRARVENARLVERLAAADARPGDDERFRALASQVMGDSASRLRLEHNGELTRLLEPLRADLEGFRRAVDEAYNTERREGGQLRDRLDSLLASTGRVQAEASRLATALRGSTATQGRWGEVVLEAVLEQSGLRRGEEYVTQVQTADDEGRRQRPDVVVRYPDGRSLAVDSKASLTAYFEAIEATDDERAREATRRHVQSVRKHVDELARKGYHDAAQTEGRVDFVVMFIPNEPAYALAMRTDAGLWDYACARGVVIASPTLLMPLLSLVSLTWRGERQSRNAEAIANAAGAFYDKLAGFVTDLETVGRQLDTVQRTYAETLLKLRDGKGNLLSRAEKLRRMGIPAKKRLAAPDDDSDNA